MYQGTQQNYPPPAGYPGGYPQGQGGYPQGGSGYPPQGGSGYPPPGGAPGYQQPGYPPGPNQPPAGYPQPPQAGGVSAGGPPPGDGPAEPSYKGEMPDDDVEVDPSQTQNTVQQPTAPPATAFDAIAGYNQFDQALQPPSYQAATMAQPPPRNDLPPPPSINEDQAKEALLQYVSEHCCYGKGAAKDMVIRDIVQSSAFHYKLETFTEKRVTKHAFEPFRGQAIDSAANGLAPGPWNIVLNPPGLFKDSKTECEVPHTASVKTCHDCHGTGQKRCNVCRGRGRIRCHFCHGLGRVRDFSHHHDSGMNHHHGGHGGHGRHGGMHHRHGGHGGMHHHHGGHGGMHHGSDFRPCTFCLGLGRKRCHSCMGHGQNTCVTCKGSGNLKMYIKLVVTWTNHVNDSIVERTALPNELIRNVTGQVAFKEESPMVWPINHFQDQTINSASKQLVDSHKTSFSLEKILMQRHQISVVPVGEVQCAHKNSNFNYFVYGFENKVHAPDYPSTCCCTIL